MYSRCCQLFRMAVCSRTGWRKTPQHGGVYYGLVRSFMAPPRIELRGVYCLFCRSLRHRRVNCSAAKIVIREITWVCRRDRLAVLSNARPAATPQCGASAKSGLIAPAAFSARAAAASRFLASSSMNARMPSTLRALLFYRRDDAVYKHLEFGAPQDRRESANRRSVEAVPGVKVL